MADISSYGGAYAAAGQALEGAITTYYGNKSARIAAEGANVVRAANNASARAWGAVTSDITQLQRWAQGVRNSRVFENAGKNQEALAVNFNRQRDVKTNANFADSLREAEESGRAQASAAASGITGSVVDVIDQALLLKNHLKDVARVRAENSANSDEQRLEFETYWGTLDNLDRSLILDTPTKQDYGNNIAQQTNLLSGALANVSGKGLQQVGIAAGKFFNFGGTGVDGFTAINATNRSISD